MQHRADMLLNKAKASVKRLTEAGFFSIFLTNILIKVVGLVGNILLVRILSKSAYGTYGYITNAYSILIILADMGTSITAVQLCSEAHRTPERQNAIFSLAFRYSMLFNLVSSGLVLFSGLFYPYQTETAGLYTASLFLLPVISNVNRFILSNAQIRMENKLYARINLFESLIRYLILLPLSCFFSFRGALYSDYVIQLCVMCFGLCQSRSVLKLRAPESCLGPSDKRTFFRLSFSSALNNIISNSLVLLDVFLLGIFVSNMDVIASYKVASNIPLALMFIPSSVEVFMMPHFARHREDFRWVRKNYRLTLAALSLFNLCVCGGGILLGPWIIKLLYGTQYTDAAVCFSILLLGYFFSSIRAVSHIAIYSQRKVQVNILVTLFSNLLNILLDILLIRKYASIGAAIASSAVNLLAALVMVLYLEGYLHRRLRSSPSGGAGTGRQDL